MMAAAGISLTSTAWSVSRAPAGSACLAITTGAIRRAALMVAVARMKAAAASTKTIKMFLLPLNIG